MSTELYWLAITGIMASLLWLPYMMNRTQVRGTMAALGNPGPDTLRHSEWAERLMAAHRNLTENLLVFAIAVFLIETLTLGTAQTAVAAKLFFFARLAHFILQALGVPVLRSVVFIIGWGCNLFLLAQPFLQA